MSLTWNNATPPQMPAPSIAEKIRMPFRILLAVLGTLIWVSLYLLCKLIETILPFIGKKPRQAMQIMWATTMCKALGIKVRMVGRPMKQGGALVSNHVSWTDIVVILSTVSCNFIAKSEVRKWPVIGILAAWADTMFIERKRSESTKQEAELKDRLLNKEKVIFFPEATSTDGLRVLPFKSSLFQVFHNPALQGLMYVQPVSVVYYPAKGRPDAFYGWWGDMDFGRHLLDLLYLSSGSAEVVFHAPIEANRYSSRRELADYCALEIREGLLSRIGTRGAVGGGVNEKTGPGV